VLLCGLVGAGALIAVADPLARLLLAAAPGAGVEELRRAVIAFAPGLPGYAVLAFASRALYARNRSRAAALATSGGWLVVIASDVVLVRLAPNGWTGAALGAGNAVGMTVAGIALLAGLRRAAGPTALHGLPRALAVGQLAAAVGAVLGLVVGSAVSHDVLSLVLAAAVAGAGMLVVLVALERDVLRRLVRR
jgi:putative peptidoglycan lipid II flippase